MHLLLLLVVVCQSLQVFATDDAHDAHNHVHSESDLRHHLFANYDKLVRPVKDAMTPVPVAISMNPLYIKKFDHEKHVLEMETFLFMNWKDEYLQWDPEEYGGIIDLSLPNSEVWKPDMSLYTTFDDEGVAPECETRVIVNHTGDAIWVPPFSIKSRTYEKYDEADSQHSFVVMIGSWTYSDRKITLSKHDEGVNQVYYLDGNPKWTLVSMTAEHESKFYPHVAEPFSHVNFTVTIAPRT